MEDSSQAFCPSCHSAVSKTAYFCSNCGKPLKEKPLSTKLSKEIWIYFVSLFLPPFGLWYVWKYLRSKDPASKRICVLASVLTFFSIVATIKMAQAVINGVTQSLELMNSMNH